MQAHEPAAAKPKKPASPPPEDEEGVVDLLSSDDEAALDEDGLGSDEQEQPSYSAEQSQVASLPQISYL